MEALPAIPFEIQATIGAILVVVLISTLQIIDIKRVKKEYELKNRELTKALERGEPLSDIKKIKVISAFSLTIQFIFGIIALIFLAGWTVFLLQIGFVGSAIGSGIFALVGIFMPFYIWRSTKRLSKEREQLIKDFESRPKPREVPKQSFEAEPVRKAPESISEEPKIPPVTEKESAVEQKTESVTEVAASKPVTKAAAPESRKKVDYEEKIPEDSMLRRHYVSHMASLKRQPVVPRKTPETRVTPTPVSETKPEVLISSEGCTKKIKVPQDSILRRHYLTNLRINIESELPPLPTDSILKRHYACWKNSMIESQITKCLKEGDA